MRPFTQRWIALLIAAAVVFYLCWLIIEPFVHVLLWAAVLAIIFFPVHERLRKRGMSDHLAAISTTGIVVVAVLLPLTFLAVAMIQQAAGAAGAVRDGLKQLLTPESGLIKWLGQFTDVDALLDLEAWKSRLGELSGVIAGRTFKIVGGILGSVVQMLLVLFTLYYLLRDAERIVPVVRDMLPLSHEESDAIFRRTHEVIAATVNGVLVIAAIQGFLGLLAFWVLGLSSPLLWGAVMFVAATIPMCGTFIVWVPAAIYLAATGHWVKATLLTVWGGAVIGTLDNMLRPRLVGQRARLHALVVFFSVLGGLKVFGMLGLFAGPVLAAIGIAMVDVLRTAQTVPAPAPSPEPADPAASPDPGTPVNP